ncbi:MAG TPA: phosphoenolpyruvate carboxykinase (ATP), partial [Gemmataceae bacterium]|nr:phosphoenolpyruvate carboxykinase (ATP) [Gemmataceae bacterium]
AGTEAGVKEPTPEFSACFGKPFLPLPPKRYAAMLKERMERFKVPVWLVNTGWTGGPPGRGERMSLAHTRALLKAALTGQLGGVPFAPDPVFGLSIPASCPGVPDKVLQPREAWADKAAYDQQATKLAVMFRDEYRKYG